MPPCSFCRKLGHTITTCKIRLKENVYESEALVESLSTAAHIAQCSPALDRTDNEGKALVESLLTATFIAQSKLAKDQKRFAEVERAGKGGDDPEEWVRVDVKKGAEQTPDVPGVSAGRPTYDDSSENPDRLLANKAQTGSSHIKPRQVCACSFDRAACGQCGRGWAQDQQKQHPQDGSGGYAEVVA